jgi:hypothetical protein
MFYGEPRRPRAEGGSGNLRLNVIELHFHSPTHPLWRCCSILHVPALWTLSGNRVAQILWRSIQLSPQWDLGRSMDASVPKNQLGRSGSQRKDETKT